MKRFPLLVVLFALSISVFAESKMDSLIKELDKEIALSPQYVQEKLSRIQSYKDLLQQPNSGLLHQYNTYQKIYEEFKNFNSDSAYLYSEKMVAAAEALDDGVLIANAKINLSFILLSTGMFREAIDSLNSIKGYEDLPDESKLNYHYVFARSYFDMADNAANPRYYYICNEQGNKYLHKALSLSNKNSSTHYFLLGLQTIRIKDHDKAIFYFEKLLKDFQLTNREIAIASSSLAFAYRAKDSDPTKSIELLAQAAIADIKSSTKETVAMTNLSLQLFKIGRIQEAYKYVKVALDEAYFYKANHRKLEIIQILPIIEGKQLSMVEKQKRTYLYYSIAVTILSLLVIAFFIIILKQYRSLKIVKTSLAESNNNLQAANHKLQEVNTQLQEVNGKLEEVNKIKEEYIGSFFNIISENIESIERFKQAITRKLKSNKPEDIVSIIEHIDIDKERERLYKTFDDIFLKIFPGFVEKFNTLFKEEDKIELKEEQSLTPELRIFALIRLGIQETETIAKILRYAVRTIYTYKTKIKNRSIVENEEFEGRLMEIKAF